jgi:O-antigen/teichoic acid export membrane protein
MILMLASVAVQLRDLFRRLFQNPLIRRIVKNSGYLFSATSVSAFMGMLQGILAARLLGPAMFGVLGAVTNFATTLNKLASFRINEMVVRYVGQYQEHGDPQRAATAFKVAILLEISGSLLAFALILGLAPLGARFFAHDESLAFWFRIYGLVVLSNLIYESSTGLLQIFDRFRFIAIVQAAQSMVTLTLIAVVYVVKGGLIPLILAYLIGKTVGALAYTLAALHQARRSWGKDWWRTSFEPLAGELRSLLVFAFSTNLSGTVSLIAKDSEVLWVSAFLGTTEAGYYKLALSLANILQLPISPLPKATYPELSRETARRNWGNVRYVLLEGSRLAALYTIPAALGLILFGSWLIAWVYKPEYLPAYPATVILLLGYVFVNIFYWNRVALLALSHPVYPTVVNIAGMVLKVGAIFLWLPQGGYLAFAWLLSGYYLFTVGLAVGRVFVDLRVSHREGFHR